MKKIKRMKGWTICQLNAREQAEYGFSHAVIHPENREYLDMGMCDPHDTDIECSSLEEAISWIQNY